MVNYSDITFPSRPKKIQQKVTEDSIDKQIDPLKLCLQLNPYLPNFWWLTLTPWWLWQWLICFFSTSRPTVIPRDFKSPLSWTEVSDSTSEDVLPHLHAVSAPKTTSWTLSSALRQNPHYSKLLILGAYSLTHSHYAALMFTLESQAYQSVTFSLSVSISLIFTFLPIQFLSGGP